MQIFSRHVEYGYDLGFKVLHEHQSFVRLQNDHTGCDQLNRNQKEKKRHVSQLGICLINSMRTWIYIGLYGIVCELRMCNRDTPPQN